MLVKMLKTTPASTNGIEITLYEAGIEYDVNDRLFDIFVNQMKVAEVVVVRNTSKADPKPLDNKMVNKSLSNKTVSLDEATELINNIDSDKAKKDKKKRRGEK